MKFAAKGDPLARVIIKDQKPIEHTTEKPSVKIFVNGKGKHFDWDSVREDLATYIHKENVRKGRSIRSIADDFECHPHSFRSALCRLGIEFVNCSYMSREATTKKTTAACLDAYHLYLKIRKFAQVGRRFGIADATAKQWILEGQDHYIKTQAERGIKIERIIQ